MVISPKAYTATLNWKAVCGESRTHGLERAVEGQPSTATLRFTGLEDLQDYSPFLIDNCLLRKLPKYSFKLHKNALIGFEKAIG